MKRTKEWWARLTPKERSELWWLERAQTAPSFSSDLIPDDCSYCANDNCSLPHPGRGLCLVCRKRLITLCEKADGRDEDTR